MKPDHAPFRTLAKAGKDKTNTYYYPTTGKAFCDEPLCTACARTGFVETMEANFRTCKMCGCDKCSNGLSCVRPPQSFTDFAPCIECGCLSSEVPEEAKQSKLSGYQNSIQEGEEQRNMTVSYTGGGNQSQGGKRGGRRERSGLPFFTREHCATDPRSTEIIAVKMGTDNKNNTQIGLKINYAGILYIWNMRTNNPNLETLIKLYGDDETRWAGKRFMIANVEDEFSGTVWPTITEDATEKMNRKR